MAKSQKTQFQYNKNKFANVAFDFIKTIIFVFSIVSILFTHFVRDANVVGSSMAQTLLNGDKVLLTNFNYEPKPGDIIAANAENLPEKRIIKRVIATEGQSLEIDYDTGKVYVDGVLLDEDYTSTITRKSSNEYKFPYVIPDNCIFVMGDNRSVSLDSRDAKLGLISEDDVIGKAQFIFYPFDRFTYLY
ncbi:MAG: signal peptidase I [Ruminococcus sp.]|nr:signal peptidase I [Ruminococcus sp.]